MLTAATSVAAEKDLLSPETSITAPVGDLYVTNACESIHSQWCVVL